MVFSLTVLTPSGIIQSHPQVTPIKLFKGLIYHVELYFPPGSSGLMGVQLSAGGHQMYPFNRESWFIGDDVLFKYDDLEYFTISTSQLDIITYNVDSQFSHEVMINIGLLTNKQFQQAVAPENSTTDLINAVNALTTVIQSTLPTGKKPKTMLLGNTG